MESSLQNSSGAHVIKANVTIALAANETGKVIAAHAQIDHYFQAGYLLFAPE